MIQLSNFQKNIIAVIVALIVAIGVSIYLYKSTGWTKFTMNRGQNFKVTLTDPSNISKIKFDNCVVTYKSNDNEIKKFDATSVLNNMVSAYEGNKNPTYTFKLDDPGLSVYSFQVSGFNDNSTRPGDKWDDSDPNSSVTMVGFYKLLK